MAYGDNSNHYTVTSYDKICEKGITKMIVEGVLVNVANEVPNIITPFKAVVKNSSLIFAEVHTGINVHNNDISLDMANSMLLQLDHSEVKVRVTSNCSASGVNRETPDKPFSYHFSYPSKLLQKLLVS
jgi:hypothetical protein